MWYFQRFRMNLSWLCLPFMILFTFLYSIYISNLKLIFLSLFSYILMQTFTYLGTLKIIEKLENKKIANKIQLLIAVCISTLFSNIGPWYSLLNIRMNKYKTER